MPGTRPERPRSVAVKPPVAQGELLPRSDRFFCPMQEQQSGLRRRRPARVSCQLTTCRAEHRHAVSVRLRAVRSLGLLACTSLHTFRSPHGCARGWRSLPAIACMPSRPAFSAPLRSVRPWARAPSASCPTAENEQPARRPARKRRVGRTPFPSLCAWRARGHDSAFPPSLFSRSRCRSRP